MGGCVERAGGRDESYPKHKPSDPHCRIHLPTGWKLSGGHAGKIRASWGKTCGVGERKVGS